MNNRATLNLNYSGRFKAEILKDNEVVRESCWSDNIVVNNYLNNIASDSGNTGGIGSIAVGTGTTAPAATDTALVNQIGTTSNSVDSSSTNQVTVVPYYASDSYTFIFNIGEVSGNITEVSANTFSGGIASRALFRDEFGDPTSVTVLADEQLRVTYEMRLTIPDTDVLATVNGYNLTIRPSSASGTAWSPGLSIIDSTANPRITAYSGPIGDFTAFPSGTQAGASSVTVEPYVVDSFQREFTYTWDTARANFDIQSFRSYQSVAFQIGVDPVIPKTSNDLLSLTVLYSLGRP
tara:strand:- start:15567 stop:16445 length:879 start_codon:yes stop_codon:yes gene_type:complete